MYITIDRFESAKFFIIYSFNQVRIEIVKNQIINYFVLLRSLGTIIISLMQHRIKHILPAILYHLILSHEQNIILIKNKKYICKNTYLKRFSAPARSRSSLLISWLSLLRLFCSFPLQVATLGSEPCEP